MNVIYFDKLSIFSLFSLFFSGVDYSYVFYFNAFCNKNFIKLFRKLGMLKVDPLLVDVRYGDIMDKKGECQSRKVANDLKDLCLEISDNEFVNNAFLKEISQIFNSRKTLLFFEKILDEQINDKVVFINIAKWHADNKMSHNNKSIIFFLEKDLWSDYLCRYMSRLGIKPIEYRTVIHSSYLIYLKRGKGIIFSKIKSLLSIFNINRDKKNSIKEKKVEVVNNMKVPLIAAWYTGRTVTFDLKKRSDFFWLLKSDIPHKQVLIYFDRKDAPVTDEAVDILNEESVRFLALSGGATTSKDIIVWRSTTKYKKLKTSLFRLILKIYFLNVFRLRNIRFFFVINMLYFARQYAYWYVFFSSTNVKININPTDLFKANIPMILALNENGGVNISYHWSNLDFSSIAMSNCSDVMFSFGPEYKWIWEANHSAINNLIYCGYITDYSFKEVKENSLKLRNQLLSKGVKFIICFFDENSSDDIKSLIPHKKSAETYEYFIRRMFEDETLGLIFKPGYPKTLYQRLSSIAGLMDKAKASERCIFMDKGSYVTEQYPTEAAQVADLCVGLLLSGTVALESYLSGTPTVFLDLEKLYSNPIYQWGKGKVVFDNLEGLFSAINKYRENQKSIPDFGDVSLWVKDRDPFKDGNASLRMGQYINWLFDMFNQGKTREKAIEYANRKYAELWGSENVVKWH